MSVIQSIFAYEIIDSRGFPTVEGRLTLDNGTTVTSSVPSGSIKGKFESYELRDNDKKKFDGMSVDQSISYINDLIAPKLKGISPLKQREIDYWLISADATKNKSRLGANTILTVSQLICKAAAADQNLPLFKYINGLYSDLNKENLSIEKVPAPIFNLINGGKHANSNLEFQEFQIIPSSSFNFSQAYQMGVEIFHELKKVLEYRNAGISVGEEGGLTPNLSNNLDALELLVETVHKREIRLGMDIFLGVNMAANYFFKNERYTLKDKPHPLSRDEIIDFIISMTKLYPLLVLEDPLSESDWDGWKKLNDLLPSSVYLTGDDLICTNKERLLSAVKNRACAALTIKPIQVGTLSETLEVISLARKNKVSYFISDRTGETTDDFLADLAVATQAEFVKFGAPSRGERVVKYNRLWKIEREELKI